MLWSCVYQISRQILKKSERPLVEKYSKLFYPVPTPQKTNMEPENHPFEKEHHLNQTFILEFHISFEGCKLRLFSIISFCESHTLDRIRRTSMMKFVVKTTWTKPQCQSYLSLPLRRKIINPYIVFVYFNWLKNASNYRLAMPGIALYHVYTLYSRQSQPHSRTGRTGREYWVMKTFQKDYLHSLKLTARHWK